MSKDAADIKLPRAVHQLLAGRKYITSPLPSLWRPDSKTLQVQALHESLSDREYQTLLLIASGKSISQIAGALSLGVSTVSTYRVRILKKRE